MPRFIDFAAVFDRFPNPSVLIDRQLCYVAVNAAYLRATSTELGNLIGRHVFDVLPHGPADPSDEHARLLRDSLERVLTTGDVDVVDGLRYRVPRSSGAGIVVVEEGFWSATHTPILDEDGRVAFVLQHTVVVSPLRPANPPASGGSGTFTGERRDVTAERRAEAAEATQRFLAESIPQQVWTALPNGELEFVNRRVLEYFGATREQILGSGWQERIHADDLPECLARWRRSLERGDEYEVEFRLKRFDGAYRWHLARALAQRGPDGRVIKWFGTNTDMDDLTRTRDLLQDRAAFEQQLIGVVSHDLRNPLNAIGAGTALLLKRGGLDDRALAIVGRLAAASDRASRLVRDLLDFTQARTAGRIPVNRVPCNLRHIARQVFDEVHVAHLEHAASIHHEGEENGFWDPDRLSQIIGNLLSNAFQHGASNGTVRLTTRGTASEAAIEVHNDGAPIPADTLARLFEPFRRGDGALVSPGRSLGLGLYISKQIALALGGSIEVRSTAAEGTTFRVTLPRGIQS